MSREFNSPTEVPYKGKTESVKDYLRDNGYVVEIRPGDKDFFSGRVMKVKDSDTKESREYEPMYINQITEDDLIDRNEMNRAVYRALMDQLERDRIAEEGSALRGLVWALAFMSMAALAIGFFMGE